MSTNLAVKAPTFTQRITAAYERAESIVRPTDSKRLAAALVEIAVDELERNPGFRRRVQMHYDQLAPQHPVRGARQRTQSASTAKKRLEDFVPVKRIPGQSFNVAERLNPYFLYDLYGADQFRDVLGCFGVPRLQEAVQVVQERNPNTSPRNKRTKESLIDYLVQGILV
jgi:hypothetical protein